MQAIADNNNDISTIYTLRCSGATLQQIADRIGRSKERVRQIFQKEYGSSKHGLMSTEQLCKITNLSRRTILELYRKGIITHTREWYTGNNRYLLWHPNTIKKIDTYYKADRLCRICHSIVPRNRRHYCSEQCYKEGHKYRYRSPEGRHRHIENVKRYRAKRKQLVTV